MNKIWKVTYARCIDSWEGIWDEKEFLVQADTRMDALEKVHDANTSLGILYMEAELLDAKSLISLDLVIR